MIHPHPAAAELRDQRFRVAREDDDRGAVEEALNPQPHLLPKRRVAGADPLVDQQDSRAPREDARPLAFADTRLR